MDQDEKNQSQIILELRTQLLNEGVQLFRAKGALLEIQQLQIEFLKGDVNDHSRLSYYLGYAFGIASRGLDNAKL